MFEFLLKRIYKAQNLLDKLRVCIICKFYSLNGQLNLDEYKNHPAIRQLKCEHLEAAINHYGAKKANTNQTSIHAASAEQDEFKLPPGSSNALTAEAQPNTFGQAPQLNKQFDIKISVGNVSKYLKNETSVASTNPNDMSQNDQSQYNQDLITHKWMIYIRSANCARIESYIKKVIFYLHSSYKPYDIVEVK